VAPKYSNWDVIREFAAATGHMFEIFFAPLPGPYISRPVDPAPAGARARGKRIDRRQGCLIMRHLLCKKYLGITGITKPRSQGLFRIFGV
jgi:hypothetical protein